MLDLFTHLGGISLQTKVCTLGLLEILFLTEKCVSNNNNTLRVTNLKMYCTIRLSRRLKIDIRNF